VLRVANEDESGALWRSLDDVLPMLAEAAPDAFLDGVRDGMDLDPSPILTLFAEGQDDTFSHPPHTGLLWALEKIAWSSRHLTRVTLILGELAHSDPRRGRWTNRPSNTLRATFLAWFPNTDADLPGRLAALDALRDRWPDMSWELLLAILPHRQTIGSHSSKPRFRDWGLEWSPTSPEELIGTIRALASRIADDAGRNGSRWAEVVPHLSELPPDDRAMLFERIGSLDPTGMHPDERLSMWNALVNEGERHLRFPDADWSLDRMQAAIFVEAAERFQDENLPEREARLFDFRVRLPDLPQGDFEAQERALAERRDHAAESVFEHDGLDGLLRLADASAQPRLVGIAAAARQDDPADGLLPLLGGEGPGAAVAAGWAARRMREEGIDWAKQQLDAAGLDVDGQTALMLELPGDDTTWDALDDLSAEVQAKYWRAATPFRLQSQQVSRVVAKLLDVGRPWAAVDVLAGCAHDSVPLNAEVVEQALLEAARSDQVDAAIHAAWEVGQLLDALEADGLPLVRLATLEFTYFALLSDVRQPRALEEALASDPGLFVELIRRGYTRADGSDDGTGDSELSTHAWTVLHDIRRSPGADAQGKIDSTALKAWIANARDQLAAIDRADVGDVKIGELLGRSIGGEDGIWPPESVRDLIEDVRSTALEDGLRCGRMNQRGTTVRDPYDGGAQEASLASGLRREAGRLEARWPRVARLVRGMAESYEADARRLDREAQRRADNA
jgi:hypothetical protein